MFKLENKMPFDGFLVIRTKKPKYVELKMVDVKASTEKQYRVLLQTDYNLGKDVAMGSDHYPLKKDFIFLVEAVTESALIEAIGLNGEKYVFE